jgi:hypothetical protein
MEVEYRKSLQREDSHENFTEDLNVQWIRRPEYDLYSLIVVKRDDGEVYLHRINISNENSGNDIISDPDRPFDAGWYIISICGQPDYIEDEMDINDVDLLYQVDFHIDGQVTSMLLPRYGQGSPRRKNDTDGGKYCRCLLSVAKKQSPECLEGKQWGKTIGGKRCYNPYAVCRSRLEAPPGGKCSSAYNFNEMSEDDLLAYARLHGKRIPRLTRDGTLSPKARQELMRSIQEYQ